MRFVVIKETAIKYCTLTKVSLRDAKLQQVDLTGTRFVECDLTHVALTGCHLWYVEFTRCKLNYASILENLPSQHNLRRAILRSLRNNAASEGDAPMANQLLLYELEAERCEIFAQFWERTPYYKERYNGIERLKALALWLAHLIQRLLWGYGLRLANLAASALLLMAILAAVSWHWRFLYTVEGSAPRALRLGEALYYTAITFCTVGFGDILPMDWYARSHAAGAAICGVVSWGFAVAAIYRRLAR